MRKYLISALLIAFALFFAATSHAAGSYGFKAKLTIDNKVIFSWNADSSVTFDIYGTDDENSTGGAEICLGVNGADGKFSHDFIADAATYYNYYIVHVKRGGAETDTFTAATEFILPRVSKEITNLTHPYVGTNQSEIDRTKKLIFEDKNPFYVAKYEKYKENADKNLEKYTSLKMPIDSATAISVAGFSRTCAVMWVLNGEQKYLDCARHCFMLTVDFLYENRSMETEVKNDGWHLMPLAITYDLIYNGLNEVDRQVIENGCLKEWMDRLVMAGAGHMSNLGSVNEVMIIMGLLLKNQEYLDYGLEREGGYGMKFLLLNEINDDGSHWNYPTMYFTGRLSDFYSIAEYLYYSGYDLFNYEISGKRPTAWWDSGSNYRDVENGDIAELSGVNVMKEMLDFCFYYVYSDKSYPDLGDTKAGVYKLSMSSIIDIMEIANKHYDDSRVKWVLSNAYGEDRSKGSFPDSLRMITAKPEIGKGSFAIGSGRYAEKGYNKLGSSVFCDYGQTILRSGTDQFNALNTSLFWSNYREIAHGHRDMLSLTMYGASQSVLFDPGSYNYGTRVHNLYAHGAAGHNTMMIDETDFDYGDYNSAPDVVHRGKLENIAIGPQAQAVKAWSDTMYMNNLSSPGVLKRTVWQLGDYAIDVYRGECAGSHQYDYLLNINGSLIESTEEMSSLNNVTLGTGGFEYIRKYKESKATGNIWSNIYTLKGSGKFRITMLGEDSTKVIAAKACGVSDDASNYTEEKLIVRRTAEDNTTFISVMQPINDGDSFRDVQQIPVYIKGKEIDWAKAAVVSDAGSGETDTFMYGVSYGSKEAGNLTSDGETSFLRQKDGEDIALGGVGMKYISGGKIGLQFGDVSAAQFTKIGENTYRLDMGQGTQKDTDVTIYGLPAGYTVYKAALDDDMTLQQWVDVNSSKFKVESEGIYIITANINEAADIAQQSVDFAAGLDTYYDYDRSLEVSDLDTTTIDALPGGIRIEAEDIYIEKGGKVKYANYDHDSHTTSNSKGTGIFSWDNEGHTLIWKFNAEKAGKYKVTLRYSTAVSTGVNRAFTVNSDEAYVMSFESTGGWGDRKLAVLRSGEGSEYTCELNEGENTIEMVNLLGSLNLDCIVLTPVQ